MQYQVAQKRSTGWSARMPSTVIRWAATVPASRVPAAMRTGPRAGATSPYDSTESSDMLSASAMSCSDGPKATAP